MVIRPRPSVLEVALHELVELAHAAAAAPAQRGGIDFGQEKAQAPRRFIMSCLISAIALAGLSPFGQVRVQFMIVWQR